MTATEPDPPRLLRIVRGEPSTEELAAVVAVMAAVAARATAVRDRA
ncbi:MAG: acyl-CoA carboxylase subunit epsilon, partial [Nocardioidaceae bacterium]|nr:acyl-CoA carboxylase subunit epsilon [Nocardioidaceae bacterium]